MGLADVLTGMMNGPRGQRQPSSGGGGGMSPIMMALLGLLAYKAFKGRGGQTAPSGGMGQTGRLPPGGTVSAAWRQARQHAEWHRGKAWRQPE